MLEAATAYIATLSPTTKPGAESALSATSNTATASIETWHERLGHVNYEYLQRMATKKMVRGMTLSSSDKPSGKCQGCQEGKQTRNAIPKETTTRATEPLGRVFSDVKGPLPTTADGYRFYVNFKDDATRHLTTYPMKTKDEVLSHFKTYLALAERQTGKQLRIL